MKRCFFNSILNKSSSQSQYIMKQKFAIIQIYIVNPAADYVNKPSNANNLIFFVWLFGIIIQ